MSILSALHQQHGSIDDLAKLPQAMIMQMAQRKEIAPEMVAPILARKAELMDSIARTKAMQGAGVPQTSVMEQVMQKNAAEEHPQTMPQEAYQAGIAQLPVEEPEYAGGGIVAFVDNPDQPVSEDMKRDGESDNAYMRRVQSLYDAGDYLTTPRNWNPVAKAGDLFESVKKWGQTPVEDQADKFNAGTNARKNISFSNTTPSTPTINSTPTQAEIDATRATNTAPAKTEPGIPSLVKPVDKTKVQPPLEKAINPPGTPETTINPIDVMLAKYEKLITGNPEDAKQARKDAFNQRLFQAGLDVMGGQSSNWAQNMSLASKAAQGYGEDIKGLRAEEQAKLTQLAGLGLKGVALKQEAEKLGITKKHYDDWYRAHMAQVNATANQRNDENQTRAEIALENRIERRAGKLLTLPKYQDNPDLAYEDAKKSITGQSGGAPVPTYDPKTRTYK